MTSDGRLEHKRTLVIRGVAITSISSRRALAVSISLIPYGLKLEKYPSATRDASDGVGTAFMTTGDRGEHKRNSE